MNPLKIKVIIGSTRPNRFSEKPAKWIFDLAQKRQDLDVEVLDLRDYPMPYYDEPASPSSLPVEEYSSEVAKKWAAKVADADGYIIVSPEYNHGYSAVLKNAMDYVYHQWNNKAVGFVSYGSVGGARAVEQLRLVAVELQMASIRQGIHIQWPLLVETKNDIKALDSLNDSAEKFLDQLTWWTKALNDARDASAKA